PRHRLESGNCRAIDNEPGTVASLQVNPPSADTLPAPGPWARLPRWVRRGLAVMVAFLVAVTIASFSYNLATDQAPPRPAGLRFAKAGGFAPGSGRGGTRGTRFAPARGASEPADTFDALGPVLAAEHYRVYAIDLTGTGYSRPSPPFSADHLAAQVDAFLRAK